MMRWTATRLAPVVVFALLPLCAPAQTTPDPAPTPTPPPTLTGARGPLDPVGLGSYALSGQQVSSGTAFNPGISVIPDLAFFRDSVRGTSAELLEEADGFHGAHSQGEQGHQHGELAEGFNLREAEIAFSGAVDPYFHVWAVFAASEEGLEAEEIYFETLRFVPGLQLKGGRLFSGIGYLNRQHPHQWDFVDQALPYQLLVGGTLAEKGLQLTWLPSLPFYAQLGAEVLQGENEHLANYVGEEEFPAIPGGAEPRVSRRTPGPRLFSGFAKVAPNLGYSSALQLGAFYVHSKRHQEVHDHDADGVPEGVLDGTARLLGADVVYKYDSPRPFGRSDLTLQGEYLRRTRDLDVLGTVDQAVFRQDGLYVQAVYGVLARWKLGARFDVAGLVNERDRAGVKTEYGSSRRYSAVVSFDPTEFSRIRAQYQRGEMHVSGRKETYDAFTVQAQFSLGVHGAHKF